jgi:adenylate cyclase
MAETRRLAAILALDMVGFSRHMQADEQGTLATLRAARAGVLEPAIARHRGRTFKTTGDGLLAEFSSVVAALQCALDIQRDLPQPVSDEVPGRFRIGISLGEVVVEGDDIFGDGVNLAARLESVASPGGIAVSRPVREQGEGKVAARFVSRGPVALKNLAEAVEVFDVAAGDRPIVRPAPRRAGRRWLAIAVTVAIVLAAMAGGAFWHWQQGGAPSAAGVAQRAGPLIAVLPFANQSGDASQDYFSDGVTEDVIAALGRFSSLAVLSRNAVMPMKGATVSAREVNQKLGARYVVEGNVRRAEDRVRIQARLTDAMDGRVLWSDRFDGSARELFQVQDELVRQIAGSLATQVGRVERERSSRKPTENLDAYELVLRGRSLLDRSTRSAFVEARGLFERAMMLDPKYADARVWLGQVLYFYVQYGFTESPLETAQQAEALLRQALEIDPSNALAHSALGQLMTYFERYDDALASIDRALAINPSDAESLYSRAIVLFWASRLDESRRAFELAQRLDPATANRPDRLFVSSTMELLSSQPERARAVLEGKLMPLPRYAPLYVILALAYDELGRKDDASQTAAQARRLDPFLDPERFGTRLRDPTHRRYLADGMRRIGIRGP